MSKKRKLLVGFAVILLAAGIYYFLLRQTNSEGPLVFYGNVDIRQVDLAFNVGGRVERMLVEEGDAVSAGQLLAVLEKERFQQRVAAMQAEVEAQHAVVQQLETGSRPEEIEEARAGVRAAEVALNNAKRTDQRRQELLRRKLIPEQEVDAAREARDLASAELQAARQRLALAEQGPRSEEITAARAGLEALEAQLALARQDLMDTELRAPEPGTILVRVVEPGAVVAAGIPVYTLALRDPVWVRAYVSEPRLGQLYPGQPVRVFTDTRPDEPYQGQIGFISPTAEFTPRTVQTPELRTSLLYRFRVIVRNPDQGLRQGMPVTVEVAPRSGSGEKP